MAGFRETMKEAVRRMAYRTSLDELRKRGVQQVNVLGIDRIVRLVEAAVRNSLQSRLAGMERDAVAEATKAEFLRLLRSNEDLLRQKTELERQRELAEQEIDQLRRELASQQSTLQQRLQHDALDLAARYQGEDAAIAARITEVVRALAEAPGDTARGIEQRLVEQVIDIVASERRAAEEARRALRDREVDNLQRRIRKLNDTLSLTEHRLEQLATDKRVEHGISSVYRFVQGVDSNDAQASRKKELMAEIFKANLALRRAGRGA